MHIINSRGEVIYLVEMERALTGDSSTVWILERGEGDP